MTIKMYAAFIASLGVALTLASNETFGEAVRAHVGKSVSTHSTVRPSVARSRQLHKQRNMQILGVEGGSFFGPWGGGPNVDITQTIPGNIHYTYTYEPLWDAAHRYQPVVSPSETVVIPPEVIARPFVPGCPAQSVTVPSGDGKEQTISIVRCF